MGTEDGSPEVLNYFEEHGGELIIFNNPVMRECEDPAIADHMERAASRWTWEMSNFNGFPFPFGGRVRAPLPFSLRLIRRTGVSAPH